MAGEKKGKAYEALVHVALEQLVATKKLAGPLHWNVTPKDMSIEPDFMTGADPDDPKTILLLNHSGSAKESEKKMWRNLGELVEAKTVLPTMPRVYCLTFGIIKTDLEPIQQHAFDQFVWVRQATHSWANELDAFVSGCVLTFPTGKDNQTEFMREELKRSSATAKSAYRKLKALLDAMYKAKSVALDNMWTDHRARAIPAAPGARNTSLRRGISKLNLFPDIRAAHKAFMSNSMLGPDAASLQVLDLVVKRPAGIFPSLDPEVKSACALVSEAEAVAICDKKTHTEGFVSQADKVKNISLLAVLVQWCNSNWTKLSTASGMKAVLQAQHKDPSRGLTIPMGCSPPTQIWIMDVIGAVLRGAAGLNQGFGLSSFTKHKNANSKKIGNMPVGDWCARFMTGYFTRRRGFIAPAEAIDFVAQALSEAAKLAAAQTVSANVIVSAYIAKEFEAVYLTHRGFEPIWTLLKYHQKDLKKVSISTCFAESANINSQAGRTTLAQVNSTLINWQSCSDAGRDHKKKELCGRAIGLRYHWNGKAFVRRPGIQKMVLVLDGTWRQNDLKSLLRAGWDEIFYPDEMNHLAKAIV
ncbi:MAG: hypothetical protein ACX93N_06770 [Pseudohaliea sp.]